MYHAVGNRCFVDFTEFGLPISSSEIIKLLGNRGFEMMDVDICLEARTYVSRSTFKIGAKFTEAPHLIDCSSFTKWLHGQKGIWIPRLAVQQYEFAEPIDSKQLRPGDLVFTSGYCRRSWHIGHVGVCTGQTVIGAMMQGQEGSVVELPLHELLCKRELRGFRRIARTSKESHTVLVPRHYEIETSDDIKCLVLSWIT